MIKKEVPTTYKGIAGLYGDHIPILLNSVSHMNDVLYLTSDIFNLIKHPVNRKIIKKALNKNQHGN